MDTQKVLSPQDKEIHQYADWGYMVPMPGFAGECILLGFDNPMIYTSVPVNFKLSSLRAMELVGQEFCSLRQHYGLSSAINRMREKLQQEGLATGVAFMASSMCVSLLNRAADDLSLLATVTLRESIPGVDTVLPLSPLHIYTLYWMANSLQDDLLSYSAGDEETLFGTYRETAEAAKEVMNFTQPVWDKFTEIAHPALHIVSLSEGIKEINEIAAARAKSPTGQAIVEST